MTWASSEFVSQLDGLVLEHGFGCDVSYVTSGPIPQITSLIEKGRPHVIPELWLNSVGPLVDEGVAEGRMQVINDQPIGGAGEGWFVPASIQETHPSLKTLEDIIARPDLFPHPDDPSKGGFHTCPVGWACNITSTNLFYAFGMDDKGWEIVDTGSGAGLDASIAKAASRDELWLGYYWAPTVLLSEYAMIQVDFGVPFDATMWSECIAVEGCPDPQPTDYIPSQVVTLTANENALPEAATEYLETRQLGLEQLDPMLRFMKVNQIQGEEAALEFLMREPDFLTTWLDADVADRVARAVN
jgi:glycine betaine/proline transport system substrate-binding protein